MTSDENPKPWAPTDLAHLTLAADPAPGEPGGYCETQSCNLGYCLNTVKKPLSFTPPVYQREKRCGNPGLAGGMTFISVENEIVWLVFFFLPPLSCSLFLIFK